MKITFFSFKDYEKAFFEKANTSTNFQLKFLEVPLNSTTVDLAKGSTAVCIFVNDIADKEVITKLKELGIQLIALRCAGYNNVDLEAAEENKLVVVRVPAYSPYSVAEHTFALILTLNRKIHRAYNRVREGNFSLGGLMGYDLHGKTIGLIGLGKIGMITAKIAIGFGCKVLGYDLQPNEECEKLGVEITDIETLFKSSDIISLHCPLTPETKHLINKDSLSTMKNGVMLVNTSRGALIDAVAVIESLKSGKIGHLGLDVYEEEAHLFFQDLSEKVIQDDVFMRLLSFPNVVITGHQAFLTQEALTNIAETTIENIDSYLNAEPLNEVKALHLKS
ncbi:MAG TPA: 2-hydroxyacid dehydrogenase [Cytophagaceae bacterium]|jgi:D-lactate dehydrogenase